MQSNKVCTFNVDYSVIQIYALLLSFGCPDGDGVDDDDDGVGGIHDRINCVRVRALWPK